MSDDGPGTAHARIDELEKIVRRLSLEVFALAACSLGLVVLVMMARHHG